MPFTFPSLKESVQRTRNAFRSELKGSDAWLWPNNIYVSAKVMGGAVSELFGKLKVIDKQRFAYTATGDYILMHGTEYGLNINPPSYAGGNVIATVTPPYTATLGTIFTRSDGVQYTSVSDIAADVTTGLATVPVKANVAGTAGNSVFGTPLEANDPNIISVQVDDFGLGGGTAGETLKQFQQRILARKRQPPQGGADYDYVDWIKTGYPGVTRVFVQPLVYGPGTVGIWFLMDGTYPNGIPQPADVANVQAIVDAHKPTTANVYVLQAIADCIDFVVSGVTPATQAIYQSVGAELLSLFANMTFVSTNDQPFTLYHTWVERAIGNAVGEDHYENVSPGTDLTFGTGTVPCLRSVTFT